PLLPRLIFLLQFAIEKSGNHVARAISLASFLGAASLMLNEARRQCGPSTAARAVAIGVGASLLFFAWQLQSMLLANAVGFPLVELFAIIAMVCVLNETEASAHDRAWTVGAFGVAILAMATTSAGLFVPIVAAALAW